jgi:hypothetical protein
MVTTFPVGGAEGVFWAKVKQELRISTTMGTSGALAAFFIPL